MPEIIQNATDDFKVQAEHEWIGKDIRVKSDPLIDPGVGKEVILRLFEFGVNPTYKGHKPNEQDIFNMHWRQIRTILWGDGLVAKEEVNPRIIFTGKTYKIFIACEPRLNTLVADKAHSLNDYLKPKKR